MSERRIQCLVKVSNIHPGIRFDLLYLPLNMQSWIHEVLFLLLPSEMEKQNGQQGMQSKKQCGPMLPGNETIG